MGLYFFLSLTVLTFSSISSPEGAISSTSASSQRSPTMSCIAWSLIDKPVSSSNISCALLYGSSVATLAPAFYMSHCFTVSDKIRASFERWKPFCSSHSRNRSVSTLFPPIIVSTVLSCISRRLSTIPQFGRTIVSRFSSSENSSTMI